MHLVLQKYFPEQHFPANVSFRPLKAHFKSISKAILKKKKGFYVF